MKQSRKMGNLIAEELEASLKEMEVTVSEEKFEEMVSSIVEGISSSIAEAVDEDIYTDDVYNVLADASIGDVSVVAGDYVEILELDMDNDVAVINTYNSDGDVKDEEVEVSYTELDTFLASESAEPVEMDDSYEGDDSDDDSDDDLDEAVHVHNGKKVKVSAAIEKLRKKLKAKKTNGVNKFTIKNGKITRKSTAQVQADKKKAKTFGKRMKRFAKKRTKSLKKSNKINSGSEVGAKKVTEGFDLVANGLTLALEAGDMLTVAEGAVTVTREGKVVASGVAVDEGFVDKCLDEGVLSDICEAPEADSDAEGIDEGTEAEDGEVVDEGVKGTMLTYKASCGYVLVKEGAEIPMGNRIRARAYLKNEGFEVDADSLDKACEGELVVL